MAKRQKISDKIQAKFDKPQFRIGDAVFFSWLGQKQYGHVIRIKKLRGVFNIVWNHILEQSIRVAYKFRGKRRTITPVTSSMTILEPSEQKNLRDAFKPLKNSRDIQKFLLTPQGKRLKAEMTIKMADQLIQTVTQKIQQHPKEDLAQNLMYHLALTELAITIQKNELLLRNLS